MPGAIPIYFRRDSDDRIVLTVKHRAAAAIPGVTLELARHDKALALQPIQSPKHPASDTAPKSVDDRIANPLADADRPQPFACLRARCRVRTTTLYQRLTAMAATGRRL